MKVKKHACTYSIQDYRIGSDRLLTSSSNKSQGIKIEETYIRQQIMILGNTRVFYGYFCRAGVFGTRKVGLFCGIKRSP